MIQGAEFVNVSGRSATLADEFVPFETFVISRDMRVTEVPRSQEHGLWPVPSYIGKMAITISGDILATDSLDYNTKRLALTGAFYPSEMQPQRHIGTMYVNFEGISERLTCDCSLESWPDLPLEALSPSAGKYNIQLKCFDPRFYGETVQQIIASAPRDTVVGRTFPKTFPFTYGFTAYPAGDQIITNAGNADTSPVITVFGPGANPVVSIIIGSTQYDFVIDIELGASDVIDIDLSEKTAILNQTTNIYDNVAGIYWKLPPGDSIFRYSASIGTTTENSRAVLSWQNAYVY